MSTINFKNVILSLMVITLFTGNIFAQQSKMGKEDRPFKGQNQEHFPKIPDLTQEQKDQIKILKTDHLKTRLSLQNQLQEKKAHLRTISTGENVNMDKVNAVIDEIGIINVKMAKKKAAHRQQVRNLLTEEQRVFFDSRPKGKGMGMGPDGKHPQQRMNKRKRF